MTPVYCINFNAVIIAGSSSPDLCHNYRHFSCTGNGLGPLRCFIAYQVNKLHTKFAFK